MNDPWQWLGQSPAEWPRWLWTKNFSRTNDGLVVHLLHGTVKIEIGDWLEDGPGRHVTVRKPLKD